jgi:hypothetical protein
MPAPDGPGFSAQREWLGRRERKGGASERAEETGATSARTDDAGLEGPGFRRIALC